MIDKNEIRDSVCKTLASQCGLDNIGDEPDIDLVLTYELDSIDMLAIVNQLEIVIGQDIPVTPLFVRDITLNNIVEQIHDTLTKGTA